MATSRRGLLAYFNLTGCMMSKHFFAAALVLLFQQPVSAEQIPGSNFGYGNWKGAAYTNDESGAFSHCAISAGYVSGDTLHFSVNRQGSVVVGVSGPNLNLRRNESFPVAINVDRRQPFYGTAVAIESDFAILEIPELERALNSFKRGYTLVVEGAGRRGTYDLTGTFRALDRTLGCALAHFEYTSTPSPAASAAVMDRTLLFQISTEIISELQVSGFRYFTEAELRENELPLTSVFWEVEELGLLGGTIMIPRGNIADLRESDPGDSQFLAASCNGDVASTARSIAFSDSPMRELRVLCVADDHQYESYLTKMMVGDQVLYTLLRFDGDAHQDPRDDRQARSEAAALRAAKFVLDDK